MAMYLENRIWQRDKRDYRLIQPDKLYSPNVNINYDISLQLNV